MLLVFRSYPQQLQLMVGFNTYLAIKRIVKQQVELKDRNISITNHIIFRCKYLLCNSCKLVFGCFLSMICRRKRQFVACIKRNNYRN
jgi:hypothetical protein